MNNRVRVVASAGLALGVMAGVALSLSPPSVGQSIGGSQAPAREVEVLNELVVRVADPISLDTSSLDTITSATDKGSCTYTYGHPSTSLGSTAVNIPASPMASRTAVAIMNRSTAVALTVVCSNAGTASATSGWPIAPSGQWWKWEGAQAGWAMSCICVNSNTNLATTGCVYAVLEERCYQ